MVSAKFAEIPVKPPSVTVVASGTLPATLTRVDFVVSVTTIETIASYVEKIIPYRNKPRGFKTETLSLKKSVISLARVARMFR